MNRILSLSMVAACATLATGCSSAADGPSTPSDDPADYQVAPGPYRVLLSDPRWIVPADNLPPEVAPGAANNNVEIVFFDGRLFVAWRTAPTHFASTEVRMVVLSSTDEGQSWDFEHEIALGTDVREPRFLVLGGGGDDRLLLHYVELASNPLTFEPQQIWRIERLGPGRWSEPEAVGQRGELLWRAKCRGERCYWCSYIGEHYVMDEEQSPLRVMFKVSDDGLSWRPVGGGDGVVYRGGVSEVGFEFDAEGQLWVVTRNEDGDQTGWGSHLCTAPAGDLGSWQCPERADPERYDSPYAFRHGEELYLVARRDIDGPFDQGMRELSFAEQKQTYLARYSLRPKRTALYRIDRDARRILHLQDLPSAGDTAFPSIRRLGPHRFLIANYTSPLDDPDISWINGQVSEAGTAIYLLTLTFELDDGA